MPNSRSKESKSFIAPRRFRNDPSPLPLLTSTLVKVGSGVAASPTAQFSPSPGPIQAGHILGVRDSHLQGSSDRRRSNRPARQSVEIAGNTRTPWSAPEQIHADRIPTRPRPQLVRLQTRGVVDRVWTARRRRAHRSRLVSGRPRTPPSPGRGVALPDAQVKPTFEVEQVLAPIRVTASQMGWTTKRSFRQFVEVRQAVRIRPSDCWRPTRPLAPRPAASSSDAQGMPPMPPCSPK